MELAEQLSFLWGSYTQIIIIPVHFDFSGYFYQQGLSTERYTVYTTMIGTAAIQIQNMSKHDADTVLKESRNIYRRSKKNR